MPEPASLAEWLEALESRHPKSIDLGLDRVAKVWARMGSPLPAERIFTVAGTNGKGSTVAYISAMVQALGYRCGTYTSPHLVEYNERVQILGQKSSDRELVSAFERVDKACGEISLTYFEFGTLAAFSLMSQENLDYAVLEVGLGGRLDAVNILDADCAVLTPVGLDHQEYLGDNREQIGKEKAGIFRQGGAVICGDPHPPQSVLRTARDLGCAVWRLGQEFQIAEEGDGLYWCMNEECLDLPRPPMPGPHQHNNLATAVAAVVCLLPEALKEPALLAQGISSVKLPGRLHSALHCPRVWLDVGHNAHAASAVASALQHLQLKPRYCVLGMLKDKDALAVVKELDPQVDTWCCAGLEGDRGRSGSNLAEIVRKQCDESRVKVFPSVIAALEYALNATGPGKKTGPDHEGSSDDSILVFGSFVTVGQALAGLSARNSPARKT